MIRAETGKFFMEKNTSKMMAGNENSSQEEKIMSSGFCPCHVRWLAGGHVIIEL
jgi:hypothetical protein